jgi:hypothetical protein
MPADRRKHNQLNNKLKTKLEDLKNEEVESYIIGLTRQDNSIWKPIKN